MSFYWRPYVPVAQRRAQAMKKIGKLKKKGVVIQPIEIEGRKIASSFWGKAWCDHLESFSDYENRLPRGRTYVRNGSVCHLEIKKGKIEAIVSGSELYNIAIDIKPLKPSLWKSIKGFCAGKIGTMLELLQGRLSDHVMGVVTHRTNGLMPQPGEIKLSCSCPDWADMCKHVAAVMYGIGSRLDSLPELLFTLRGVDATELIDADLNMPISRDAADKTIAADKLSDIFDIEIDQEVIAVVNTPAKKQRIDSIKSKEKTKKAFARSQNKSIAEAEPSKAMRLDISDINLDNPKASDISIFQTRLGLSVAEFADRLGVAPATVYGWYKKKGRLNLHYHTQNAINRLKQKISSK